MTAVGLSDLVVEVLHSRGDDNHPDWTVGSGFFVGRRLVLTALHNVDGPGELLVRVHGKEEHPAIVLLQGDKDSVDLALLEVTDVEVDVPLLRYGTVDRSASAMVEQCWAVGFPRFKERARKPKPLRLSAQVNGEIPTGENLGQPLLTLHLRRSPRPLPAGAIRESEWAGMSGAAVFSGNNIIVGVITEHYLPEGESALTVVPITALDLLPQAEATKWWKLLDGDHQALVRLPKIASSLSQLGRAEEEGWPRSKEEYPPASARGHQTYQIDRKAQEHLYQESVKSVSSHMQSRGAEESNLSSSPQFVTEEGQENIGKSNSSIYGSVQGLVYGEHNTITLNFYGNEKRTVPFLAPPKPTYPLVGRDDLIGKLKQQLFGGGNLALSALNGIPGVGKTALALVLAHDPEVLGYFNDGVLWAGLGREPNVFSYLVTWGLALSISPSEMEKITNITMLTQAVHRAIGTRRMLLVVDDAWSVEAALAFKLGGPYCAHLVTTRIPEVADTFAGDGTIIVQELGEEDGLTLLGRLAPGIIQTAPNEARELVRTVGGLPLPLTLMGKYLRIQIRTGQPRRLRAALDQLHDMEQLLHLSQPQIGLERHPSLPEGVPLSQLAVIQVSDEALNEEAKKALRAFSVFPPKPNTFSEEAALAVAATSAQAIDTLVDFGLLESSGTSRYTLHQAISDYAKTVFSDTAAYNRMVEYFLHYVEVHKTDTRLLEQETSNVLAAVETMLERGMNPAGASAFAYFIRLLRKSRTI
jgi:hypothetical protein